MTTDCFGQVPLKMAIVLAIIGVLNSPAASQAPQDLVNVDGVTPTCVVNEPRQVQHPGPDSAILFGSPQYGYCNGSIQHNCSTARHVNDNPNFGLELIRNACVGTFTSWADLQRQNAQNVADLQKTLQQQLNILKSNIQALSDSNDALTKRLNDLETKVNR